MKSCFLFLFLIVVPNIRYAQSSVEMVDLRKLFYLSTLKESYLSDVEAHLNEKKAQPTFESYHAMVLFMKAKYAINPYSKLNHFKKGKNKMEDAITTYPNDIESRFLRLAIQVKLPSFLNYNTNKEEDINFILDNYSSLKDSDLKKRIKLFFKENDILTTEQYQKL